MENQIQNNEGMILPDLDSPPQSGKKSYYLGLLLALFLIGGVVFYLINSKTTLYKGSLKFAGNDTINYGSYAKTNILDDNRYIIASALTDNLQSQIAALETKLAKTSDPTEKRILSAQLASLKIQLASEEENSAIAAPVTPIEESQTRPAGETNQYTNQEEHLTEFDRLIELFGDAKNMEEMDKINDQLFELLNKIDPKTELTFARPDKEDLVLTIKDIQERLNKVYGKGENDIYYDKVETAKEPIVENKLLQIEPPVIQEVTTDNAAPIVTTTEYEPLPIEIINELQPTQLKADATPEITEAAQDNFTSATIQGETGPEMMLYPLSVLAANLGWYIRKKKKRLP